MESVREALEAAVKSLYEQAVAVELTRPEEQFGDFSTNVALQLASALDKNPRDIAQELVAKLKDHGIDATMAGPGFINIRLNDDALVRELQKAIDMPKPLKGQEILVEFGDPNPFKEMHIGHLYSYIVGDSISRLLEAAGADVKRLSYHGDVGLHVAKAIYGMRSMKSTRELAKKDLKTVPREERFAFIEFAYAFGAAKYEDDQKARNEIDQINLHVYKKDNLEINELYETGKTWSIEFFDVVLDDLKIKNEKRYFESESAKVGIEFVRKNIGKVFEESNGAVVYKGEKAGLHTRVFLTSKGLPTYEAKDLGLAELKNRDFPEASRSIVVTAHEQEEYFKVMLAALAQIDKTLVAKTTHLTHGFLSLSTGKMSSRTGDVYTAVRLILDVKQAARELYKSSQPEIFLGAVKYEFLKHRLGTDIVYDVTKSVSLEGNSGPYLQYAHSRARSILAKAGGHAGEISDFEAGERSLARKIIEYPEMVAKATTEMMPHHICTYLYELAQTFNRFYENNRVVGDERESQRLALIAVYAEILKQGLGLLGIQAPDKM